jgi:hypothetical protein
MTRRRRVIAKIVWRQQLDRKKLIRALVEIAQREQDRRNAADSARQPGDDGRQSNE